MSSPDPTRVTFFSDGIQLVGYLYLPPDFQEDQRRSAVLVCHGFGAHQARFLPEIAEHLAAQGHVVMMFDYRGFGESEGPRWRMIPLEQVADIRNALTFLSMQPSVDPDRIGLYGTSFGGANVVYAAAEDSRVQCVVSTVGVGNGARWLRSLRREWEWRDFLGELEEDRETRVTTGKSRVVGRLHIMTPDPDTAAAAEWAQERFPESCSDLPLETAQAVVDFHPDRMAHLISPRPVLFIVAGRDVLVANDITRELYDLAGEPKGWTVVPGARHYDVYSPPAFGVVMKAASDWYAQHLAPVT